MYANRRLIKWLATRLALARVNRFGKKQTIRILNECGFLNRNPERLPNSQPGWPPLPTRRPPPAVCRLWRQVVCLASQSKRTRAVASSSSPAATTRIPVAFRRRRRCRCRCLLQRYFTNWCCLARFVDAERRDRNRNRWPGLAWPGYLASHLSAVRVRQASTACLVAV